MSCKIKCRHCGDLFEPAPNKLGPIDACPKHPYGIDPTPQKPTSAFLVPDKLHAAAFAFKEHKLDARLAEKAKRDKGWAERNQTQRRKR